MGSLMAGWQTNPLDEKAAIKRSKSSVTKEEVERFWKSKGQQFGRQLSEVPRKANPTRSIVVPSSPGSDSEQSSQSGSLWGSPPMTPTTPTMDESSGGRSPGWWRKSYWAFLNEPPILEDAQNRYVSQYHVGAPNSGSKPYTVARTESNIYLTNKARTSFVS